MKILAIIPARGGSKGIPKKNIKKLNGKPLISYSIEEALKSNFINKVVVSSENEDIEKISKSYGAETIKRPKNLAKDDSLTIDTVFHSLDYLEENQNYVPDIIILLQPTSPLREVEDIENSINSFIDNECNALVSVNLYNHSPCLSLRMKNGYLCPLFKENYLNNRRQDFPEIFRPNGAIYILKPETLKKYKTFYPNKTIPYVMPAEKSVDIDSMQDWKLAEYFLKTKGS